MFTKGLAAAGMLMAATLIGPAPALASPPSNDLWTHAAPISSLPF
jgi:hypothetical protein